MGLAFAIFLFGLIGGFKAIGRAIDSSCDCDSRKIFKDRGGYFSNKWYP